MSTSDLRLRRHADFQLVYKNARKQYAKEISFFFARRAPREALSPDPSPDGEELGLLPSRAFFLHPSSELPDGPRVGLTVGKVLGKAHDRNRIKRRLRSAVRLQAGLLAGAPVDVVLHPRRTVLTLEWARLEAEVAQIFRTIHKMLTNAPRSPHQASSEQAKAGSARNRPDRPSPLSTAKPAADTHGHATSSQPRNAERKPSQRHRPAS